MDSIIINNKRFDLHLSPTQIQTRVRELASQINAEQAEGPAILLPILNGAFMFAADLVRELTFEAELSFIKVSSYGSGMTSSKKLQMHHDTSIPLEGKHVLLIEDIVDSGFTSQYLFKHVEEQNAASVKLVSLLFKPNNFQAERRPDYIGFDIPSDFVVGYGMDFAQRGRDLDGIYCLSTEEESKLV